MTAAGLEIRGVRKTYGTLVAVNDLDMAVRPGEVFGFVGSNGAGKTTTMRVVLGTLTPDRGEVLWDGSPIEFEVRRRIGYMPEERGLYPKMRIGEQLMYLAQLHGATQAAAAGAVARWLERFQLKERARDELQKLSHGNQQRVQLAAALVFEPLMLVLDEPFAGLDPEAVDSMSEVLHERAQSGIPVIFSSHQLEIVERICHRVGILQRGRLVACGTIDELRSRGPRQLWVDAPYCAARLGRLCQRSARGANGRQQGPPPARCVRRRPGGPARRFGHRPGARVPGQRAEPAGYLSGSDDREHRRRGALR